MANLLPNFNAESFFANLRANGYNLTEAEQTRVTNLIVSEGRNNGLFAIVRQGFSSAWRVVQALFDFSSDMPLGERLSAALNVGDRFGDQREVNELMHRLRDSFQDMGGNIAVAASAITGDTSGGRRVMRGNLRDIAMTPLQPTAEELRRGTRLDVGSQGPQPARYAVVDTNEVAAPQTPSATRALTGYAQGA